MDPSHSFAPLLQPFQLGDLALPNRVVMAPLTRGRAGRERIPNAVMAEYVPQPYPARAAVGVASLPRGALVEIDAVLVL